ncbi:fungal-specific transcription factor domain-containing protein [Cristinia sonorae]|uniref:Fungal-specific transcription factor domain-containing protein n=1 Tax=Cristinia sonorae TaxID=1940300 RepID=A0A8K0XUI8_9AGAR|nr:fungal-specific transcription factor domain-containing protein [Cristinia sonorae]
MVMTESSKSIQDPSSSNDKPPLSQSTSKKKRNDDQPLAPDIGMKPVQLQRRRVWRACESCRRKKIKCDGTEPTCSQCAATKSQCTWLQTKDRAALSRHYVQELEARLLHMETLFQQVAPILEQVGTASGLDISQLTAAAAATGSSNDGSPAGGSQHLPSSTSNGLPIGPDDGMDTEADRPIKVEDDVSDAFGQLALDEHGHMRWIGGSSTMSLIQSFRSLTSPPLNRVSPMDEDPLAPGPSANKLYFPASVFFGKVRALPHPEEVDYPDRDLADMLVDAYFTRFHFLMPVLDKPSFMRQYLQLMDNTHDIHLVRSQTPFLALVFAVFAAGSKLVDDPRLKGENLDDAGMGMPFYERALILHYISHASMQVEHVQCFLVMSFFLCSVNCLPQAWLLVGQALRTAQDIGLHRSPRRLLITPIEKETRRKVWWGCYTMDRMLALALGRPLGIADSDCDIELPVDVEDENLPQYFAGATMTQASPSLMRGFIEMCTLYTIAGRVLRQVYALDKCKDHLEPDKRNELNRSVESLDKELTAWCDELPLVFKSNPVTEKQVSMGAVLCSHYYSILTTLHRNFLPVKRDQPVWPRSTAKAVSTARACIRLAPSIRNVVPSCHHLALFIQNLFSSAVIILLYAMHTTDLGASQTAMEEAKSCLGVLESWEGHWPGARKCKELLEDLAGTAAEAIKTMSNGQGRAGASAAQSSSTTVPVASRVPSNSPSHAADRRSGSMAVPVSAMKSGSGQRRNRSREVRISPHQVPSYRHDPISQRARSTSRKRPVSREEEYAEMGSSASLASVLSGSYQGRPTLNASAHSSPVSAHSHPSPPQTVLEYQESTPPHGLSAGSFGLSIPQSPTVQVPGSSQFDYDFGLPHSPTDPRWNGDSASTSQAGFSNNFPQTPTTIDTSYLNFNAPTNDLPMSLTGLTTPSEPSGFNGPGLPFRGLDYIRNYNPSGYLGATDQDGLWQTFDSGTFGFDPEMAFTFGDFNGDEHGGDGQQQHSQQWSSAGQS